MDEAFGERLKEAMHLARIGTKALATEAGVHPVTVSGWRRGRRPQSPAQIEWLAERLGVATKWLKTAEGSRDRTEETGARALREVAQIAGYTPLAGPNTRAAAADDAQKVAGQIVLLRMKGRSFMPVGEAIEYMAAVTEAAAGRPIKLPPVAETPAEELPPGQTGT